MSSSKSTREHFLQTDVSYLSGLESTVTEGLLFKPPATVSGGVQFLKEKDKKEAVG